MKWYRSKPDEDSRDIRIRELAAELGAARADAAQARAERDAANRELAHVQRCRDDDNRNNARVLAAVKEAHFTAVNLMEAERDKALARLTAAETANVDALLDELNDVKKQLRDAEDYAAVVIADKADLRAQLKARDEQEVRT